MKTMLEYDLELYLMVPPIQMIGVLHQKSITDLVNAIINDYEYNLEELYSHVDTVRI